ncbi:transcriptional regulator [Elasticomyces elasticus]|nr:transcriptional regulator [Elasticomyces elasticus]
MVRTRTKRGQKQKRKWAPLDLEADTEAESEFPSLSGGPQAQQSANAGGQAWNSANPSLRQQPPPPPPSQPVQRPQPTQQLQPLQSLQPLQPQQQPQPTSSEPQPQQPPQQAQQSRPPDDLSRYAGGLDQQFDGQSTSMLRASNSQSQQGGEDDFPPLSGQMNGDARLEQRVGSIQSQPFGSGLNGNTFGSDTRSSSLGHANGQGERATEPAIGGQRFGSGATTNDSHRSPTNSQRMVRDSDREIMSRIGSDANNQTFSSQQPPFRDGSLGALPQSPLAMTGQHPLHQNNINSGLLDSPSSAQQQPQRRRRLSGMTEAEKWGLPGLLAMLPGNGEPGSAMMMGHELHTLGLDLDNPNPIFPTFTTPFAEPNSRPVIPDFKLPPAYTVTNVPPLAGRITGFSDETLFAIFYQFTRDIMQEVAAAELYHRDWRWNIDLKQWMMKDPTPGQGQPVQVGERTERGVYVFFDALNWRRERREYILNYDDLDQRHGASRPNQVHQ